MPHTYASVNEYLQNRFGEKIYKLSLNAGMTCPNRDGSLGSGGCFFCSEGGSGDFACGPANSLSCTGNDIVAQIEEAKKLVKQKTKGSRYIAYFQAFTNTYAPIDYLRNVFYAAINHPDIAILSVATRCDCINEDVVELLCELNRIKPVWVEMGMQSCHDKTLSAMNCHYTFEQFEESSRRLHENGIDVIAHVILGLPGETREMMLESVRKACSLPISGIKLQLLHILKNTELARIYEEHPFDIMSMEEYCDLIVECIDIIPENIIVHRLTGDGPRKLLIAPMWSTDKKKVLNTLNKLIRA
jgi:radical SAM protein (TIGR01212 family)